MDQPRHTVGAVDGPWIGVIRELEALVLETDDISCVALRYGNFYGPGTSIAPDGAVVDAIRRRQFPIVGGGTGVWSFIHIADAAYATLAAIEHAATGAKPPRQVPAWVGRLLIGASGVSMMTKSRGSSNARAKSVLNWRPVYASWREGFREWREQNAERRTANGRRRVFTSGARI